MVPKFCFPFDVERYRKEQTPRDPGTQGPKDQGFIHPEAPGPREGLGHSETLTTGDLYNHGPRLVDIVHIIGGWGAQGPVTPGSLRAFPTSREPPSPAVQHFTFALTDLTGTRRFGFCRLRAGAHSCLCILRCGIQGWPGREHLDLGVLHGTCHLSTATFPGLRCSTSC